MAFNQAHLITSAADLIYMLGWEVENKTKKQSQTLLFEKLSKDENVVFNYLIINSFTSFKNLLKEG